VFEKRGKSVEVDVSGSLVTSDSDLSIRAALDGHALARAPRHAVEPHLAAGNLVMVLEDWRPKSVGFYFYYPSRRQMPAALQALVEILKVQASSRRADPPASSRPLHARPGRSRASRPAAK